MKPDPMRTKDLARIHLAKKDLGLDDETYRELLKHLTGKTSAGELTSGERWKVIQELGRAGAKSAQAHPGKPPRPKLGKEALIGKIEAQLAEAKRPWEYAHAMAKRMFGIDQVQWLDAEQLRKIVAALVYDAKRHGRRV